MSLDYIRVFVKFVNAKSVCFAQDWETQCHIALVSSFLGEPILFDIAADCQISHASWGQMCLDLFDDNICHSFIHHIQNKVAHNLVKEVWRGRERLVVRVIRITLETCAGQKCYVATTPTPIVKDLFCILEKAIGQEPSGRSR